MDVTRPRLSSRMSRATEAAPDSFCPILADSPAECLHFETVWMFFFCAFLFVLVTGPLAGVFDPMVAVFAAAEIASMDTRAARNTFFIAVFIDRWCGRPGREAMPMRNLRGYEGEMTEERGHVHRGRCKKKASGVTGGSIAI